LAWSAGVVDRHGGGRPLRHGLLLAISAMFVATSGE